jgi:REP element-mobilizing transposase RayT
MPSGKPEGPSRGPGLPYNPGLLRLIEGKRQWNYSPDTESLRRGFRGWHERGHLPHFDAPQVTQFVTLMLADAFPITRRREWESILREPGLCLRRRKLEAWLDRGHGRCELRDSEIARCVEEILRSEDGQTYRLQAWVVMPNHVHLVVDVSRTPLSKLLHLWKGRSAHAANQLLGRQGRFWAREYYDTLVRNGAHLDKSIRYTENNPAKAGFVSDPRQWPWSSAHWRDEYERLPWQREGDDVPR